MKENVYNTSKLAFHKEKLKALANGKITAPIYVRIKPTNKCDHHCSYCSYEPGSDCPVSETINRRDEIPKEKMIEILSDFKDIGVKAVTYSGGGEPLIYPYITEVMEKTIDSKIELSIITNGQKLNGKKAEVLTHSEWIRISLSEIDAESFSKTRRVPERWFYDLTKNIAEFSKAKKPKCELGINFVVHKGNSERVYDAVKFFKELGVNHIKITPVYNPDFLSYHADSKESILEQIARARQEFQSNNFSVYDTYENDFTMTGLNERRYDKCYIMQTIPVIGADSVVYFCHDKTYNKKGMLGSIKDKSFKELWFSDKAKKIFRDFNPKKNCRHHCTYDSRNIITADIIEDLGNLHRYKPRTNKHKNFI